MTRWLVIFAVILTCWVDPAWAFPTIANSNTTTDADGSDGTTLNLPANIVAGNLLIGCVATDNNLTATAWPAGWTELSDTDAGSDTLSVAYRFADGTEGSTIALTHTGTADDVKGITVRITGAHASTAPEVGTAATYSASVNPDPPSLNPGAWGTEDTLWIVCISESSSFTMDTDPSGYSGQISSIGTGTDVGVFLVSKQATAASDDPGTATLSSAATGVAQTIAVRPSAQSQAPRSEHQYRLRRKE